MTLNVIGAGFGRTGTESMKRALEILGKGPCYHMFEVIPHVERCKHWRGVNSGAIAPDWDQIFNGYSATLDWPSVLHWKDILKAYPTAKVILTTRDAESWYRSMENTILKVVAAPDYDVSGTNTLSVETQFGGNFDRQHMIDQFNAHVADVQASVPADQLLIFPLGAGWDPLCEFLDCPVPSDPFPRGNAPEAFHQRNG